MSPSQQPAPDPGVIFSELVDIDLNKWNTQLVMAAREADDAPSFQLVPMADGLHESFRQIVAEVIAGRQKEVEDNNLQLMPYSATFKPDSHQIEFLHLPSQGSIGAQLSALEKPHDLDEFKGLDKYIKNLKFYAIILTSPNGKETILSFRLYTPKKQLRKAGLIGMFFENGTFKSIEDTTMLFDDKIDCIVWKEHLFILQKDRFHKIFKFYDDLVKTAKATLKIIEQRVPIEGFPEFAQACQSHLLKLAKLKNIAQSPYLQTVTMKDFEAVITKFSLSVQIVGKGSAKKLKYDPADKWALLKLLDDDYLQSVMTQTNYEVNSKRPL